MLVIKRDGSLVDFDYERIYVAIEKAYQDVYGVEGADLYFPQINDINDDVYESIESVNEECIGIELVQDIVIECIKKRSKKVSDVYKEYREERTIAREKDAKLFKSIYGLITRSNEEVMNENSNKNAVLASTQRDLIAGEVSKEMARKFIIPKHISKAHDEGAIHWHDMDYTIQDIFNCCLVNLGDMLDNGTVINEKLVESPKSFATACTVMTQIASTVSSGQYGGQSHTIRYLAPYLRKTYTKAHNHYKNEMEFDETTSIKLANDMMLKELKDGVQTIRYQLSTLQTSNGQAPFCTIYLEIIEGDEYEKEQALICEEMIKQRLEGMKNYKGQEIGEAFPKLVYVLDKHNCLEGGKYDYITELCAKCNVKRLVPDYQSAKIMRKNYEGNNFPPINKTVA